MRVTESFSRDIYRIVIWFPVRWMTLLLTTRIDFLIFKILGNIAFIIQREKRKKIIELFSKYLNSQKKKIIKKFTIKYFENHFIDRLHIFLYPRLRKSKNKDLITIAGEKILEKSLSKGKGVIILHGHFGPIQLQLLELAKRGYNINQIGLLSDDKLSYIGKKVAFRLREKYEGEIGAKILRADKFLREPFHILDKGGIIMMTGDGTGTEKKIGKYTSVNFLSEKIQFPTGAYSLASKTGADLIPVTIHRQLFDRYCINFYKPITIEPEQNIKDFSKYAQKFASFLEDKVISYPCHWHFWDDFTRGKLISEKDHSN